MPPIREHDATKFWTANSPLRSETVHCVENQQKTAVFDDEPLQLIEHVGSLLGALDNLLHIVPWS